MKKLSVILLFAMSSPFINAQSVGIGTNTPNVNAALEIRSNNKGVLMPRLNTVSKNAMSNVPKGMMVYDSTLSAFYYHDGGKWRPFSESNTDSLVRNYSGPPQETVNIGPIADNQFTSATSGILYDNGGPSANYGNSRYDAYSVVPDDSTVGFSVVVEQASISPGDTLAIVIYNDLAHARFFTGSTTGTYYFAATSNLVFLFQSNATTNATGFRIRWSKITAVTDKTAPLYGWYFDAKKMAVRGGINSNNDWASDSLGKFSFAYGNSTAAKGINAVAMGENVSSPGNYSIALGQKATASGVNSFSAGTETVSSGPNSIAMGRKVIASEGYAVAIGNDNEASGFSSIAIGNNLVSSDQYTIALGENCTASASFSTAIGINNSAINTYATALGSSTTASGSQSTALGNHTTSSGTSSTAMGDSTTATSNSSTAMGNKTTASGNYTTATGLGTIARAYASFAAGAYNVSSGTTNAWVAADPLFIIGNGTSAASRSNAMMLLKNGNTGIGTSAPQTKLHISGGTDASLADNSGYFIIGDVNGSNLVFDNNEIISRNNGANNTLFFQNNGGPLETGGTAAKPGGGSWAATSDARLKQNVKPYTDGLQQLLKINPVYYQYNQLSGYDTRKQYVGVLAQELKEVAPYMVGAFKKNDTEYYNVDNTAMTYMLINAVKEQQKQIETQQKQIDELTNALNLLLKK